MKNRDGLENSDHWKTPPALYEKLDQEFNFDFDPCPYKAYFDGLLAEWGDSNWVNPPYSKGEKACNPDRSKCKKKSCVKRGYHISEDIAGKDDFIKKAFSEWEKGKSSVLLIPVATGTDAFENYIYGNAEIRAFNGRLKFIGFNTRNEWVTNNTGKHDSMLVIFRAGEKIKKFSLIDKDTLEEI